MFVVGAGQEIDVKAQMRCQIKGDSKGFDLVVMSHFSVDVPLSFGTLNGGTKLLFFFEGGGHKRMGQTKNVSTGNRNSTLQMVIQERGVQ